MYLEDVEKLNKDSILDRDLFVELMEYENEIDRTEKVIELVDKAKLFGVKEKFKAMYSACLKEKKKFDQDKKKIQRTDISYNMTDFSGDYQSLNCGCWIANDGGIYTMTMFGEKVACPHPILPVQILTNAETGFCKVKLAYKVRNKWREVCIDKEIISSNTKITSLAKYGIMVTSENSKALVQYLSDIESLNEDSIVEQVSTSKLGWIGGEFMPYGQNIVFDNEQNLKVVFDSIKSVGDRDTWYNMVKSIRQKGKLEAKIYIVASLASILVEPLNALPFVVNLWGDTGKGKTVALMLATSIWASPNEGTYMSDAKATVTAMETRMGFLNSLPMLMDDMAQVKNQYDGDFSSLIYLWCAGKGKERSNRNLGLNSNNTWRNVIITNAEHSLVTSTMQGGAVNRIIDVEMSEGYIFDNGNEVVETLKSNYGFAGREFVEVVKDLGTDAIKAIQKDFYNQIVSLAEKDGVEKEEKQILPMSILLTADKLANEHLFNDGYTLDLQTCVDLLKNRNEVSENERAYQYVLDEISINMNKFKPDTFGEFHGEQWGCLENGKAVIIGNAFNRILQKGGFSEKSFLSWAVKNNIVECGTDGKAKKVKRWDGKPTRCVFLTLERMIPENEMFS